MKHVLRRTAVVCLAVPAITLLGVSAAQADCRPSSTASPSADASPNPFPTLSGSGTNATCSVHGDSHTDGHTHSHDMSDMPGMENMDDMDDMDMPGMDHDMDDMEGMEGMEGSHTHGGSTHGQTDEVDRPRTAVLTAFGVVNLGVLASAAVVRRRSQAAKKGAGR
jgi:hypothetical protein